MELKQFFISLHEFFRAIPENLLPDHAVILLALGVFIFLTINFVYCL